jgi:hypothetical protein
MGLRAEMKETPGVFWMTALATVILVWGTIKDRMKEGWELPTLNWSLLVAFSALALLGLRALRHRKVRIGLERRIKDAEGRAARAEAEAEESHRKALEAIRTRSPATQMLINHHKEQTESATREAFVAQARLGEMERPAPIPPPPLADARWSALAKEMAAVMDPFESLIYRDGGEEHAGSLQTFFAYCLNHPDHDFIRRGDEMQDDDKEKFERRKAAYVGWKAALANWDGSSTHARFLNATRDLDGFTRQDFDKAHGLMLECIEKALQLNRMVAQWLRSHLGLRLITHQMHNGFADELEQFLKKVLDFERKVKVETGEVSPLLRQGYGPLKSSDDRLPYPGSIG